MSIDFNQVFEGHEQALAVHRQRLKLVASNLANSDTPGYKARDLDFRAALSEAREGSLRLAATRPNHIGGRGGVLDIPILYRVPEQPSMDGNTVDSHREKVSFTGSAIRYQSTLNFLSQRIKGLKMAITGGR